MNSWTKNYFQRGTIAIALALVVAALATEADAGRRRNQKFWKSRRRDRDRNSANDDFFRWGKGAAAGRQANMAFKLPDGRTTVSKSKYLMHFYHKHITWSNSTKEAPVAVTQRRRIMKKECRAAQIA